MSRLSFHIIWYLGCFIQLWNQIRSSHVPKSRKHRNYKMILARVMFLGEEEAKEHPLTSKSIYQVHTRCLPYDGEDCVCTCEAWSRYLKLKRLATRTGCCNTRCRISDEAWLLKVALQRYFTSPPAACPLLPPRVKYNVPLHPLECN